MEEQIWDIVLYYKRKATYKPTKPDFNEIKESNSELDNDSLLDIFSSQKLKYQEDLIKYENNKNDEIISGVVFITDDDDFSKNIKKVENFDFFIEWEYNSKLRISQTIFKSEK